MSEAVIRPKAEPITAVIAKRVHELRKRAGMNQEKLAAAMGKMGVPWKRTTVVNLEKRSPTSRGAGSGGGRDSISVQELLALALVFDVPPVMLIADPRCPDQVPVAEGLTVDAWDALLWLSGSGTIGKKSDLDNFTSAAWLIQAGWGIVESLVELHKRERVFDPSDPTSVEDAQNRDDARHRAALRTLGTCVARITAAGAPLPPILPLDELRRRARELDVDLPAELD